MVASALMGQGQLLGLPIKKTKGITVPQPTVKWYKLGVLEPHISIITGCRLVVSLLNFPSSAAGAGGGSSGLSTQLNSASFET